MSKLVEQTQQLSQAISRLEEALLVPKTNMVRDSAIQRFEFCLDLSWKTLKSFLEDNHGIIVKSPKDTFRNAYQQGIIDYDSKWIELVNLRNETVHTYNEAFAEIVYGKLTEALSLFQDLSSKITQRHII